MAAKYGNLQQNQWASYQLEDTAYNFGAGQTNAIVLSIGGIYRATLPTYADGDAAMAHFTAAGRLMVDTELTLDGDIIVNNLGGAAAKDAPIAGNPLQAGIEAANFDGLALPTPVSAEGDVTYPKGSLSGVPYVMIVNEDGSGTPLVAHDTPIAAADGGTVGLMVVAESKNFDGAALPNAVSLEGDAVRAAATLSGVQYTMQVNADGSLGTLYAEDSAHSSGHGGTFVLAVRNDAGTSLVGTDGDYAPLQVDANGALVVSIANVDYVDDSGFVVATDRVLGVGLLADEVATDSVDEGDIGIPRMTLNRQAIVTHRLTDGTELAYGAGAVGATVPRTTLASDDPAVTSLAVMDDWDNAAYAETENESSNSAFTTSVIYGLDTEAGAGSQLRAVQVAVDNAGLSATPNLLIAGGIYKAAPLDTYADNDAVPFHFDVNGRLLTTSELFDYTDDSNEFTVGSSVGLAVMGVATTDSVDAGDVGALAMTTTRRLHVASSALNGPDVTNATGALAINTSTAITGHFRLVCMTLHFNSAPTTSENVTVTLDAFDGAAYDTVLFSVDPSATAATDVVFIPDKELLFENGDQVNVAFTNTDGRTYGLRVVTQLV